MPPLRFRIAAALFFPSTLSARVRIPRFHIPAFEPTPEALRDVFSGQRVETASARPAAAYPSDARSTTRSLRRNCRGQNGSTRSILRPDPEARQSDFSPSICAFQLSAVCFVAVEATAISASFGEVISDVTVSAAWRGSSSLVIIFGVFPEVVLACSFC